VKSASINLIAQLPEDPPNGVTGGLDWARDDHAALSGRAGHALDALAHTLDAPPAGSCGVPEWPARAACDHLPAAVGVVSSTLLGSWFRVRSRVQSITPKKAVELLEANTTNRPLSMPVVRAFAEAMKRGDWLVTHQGIAFDTHGVLVDGQHRLAAIIEADVPIEVTVFTEVEPGTFDVLDTGKRRNAADVLAIEGEKNSTMLAAMVRTVWLYENRPDLG
jgi:hypothetical protein